MFLASCGYWGGNPELILKAPASLVASAITFAMQKEKRKFDLIDDIADSVSKMLGGLK